MGDYPSFLCLNIAEHSEVVRIETSTVDVFSFAGSVKLPLEFPAPLEPHQVVFANVMWNFYFK